MKVDDLTRAFSTVVGNNIKDLRVWLSKLSAVTGPDAPQVEPVEATHAQMVAMRDQGKLIPGQLYRITDYVTTVNEATVTNARSAGHPFDIIVMALDATTLSEDAWAIQHDGDEYFANSNLAAWKLRYTLDNIQWSAVAGTYAVEENDGYSLTLDGTVEIEGTTYLLWKAESGLYEDYDVTHAVSEDAEVGTDLLKYDPESGEILGDEWSSPIESVNTIEESGLGTITWMKDEFGNECPYDFKNIQFKRWKVTDSMEGRTGFTDTYLGVLNSEPANLTIEDEDDFIWAYTFSSNADGGEQSDYSLDGTHSIYGNIIREMGNGSLPDNVFFGEECFANTLLQGCTENSFSRNCSNNRFANKCNGNSFSYNCGGNNLMQGCRKNSFSQNCSDNSFSQNCYENSLMEYCRENVFQQSVYYIELSNGFMQNFIVECGNKHLIVSCSQTTSVASPCRNIKIEQGVGNRDSSKNVTISTRGQDFQTVVKNANSVEITA